MDTNEAERLQQEIDDLKARIAKLPDSERRFGMMRHLARLQAQLND